MSFREAGCSEILRYLSPLRMKTFYATTPIYYVNDLPHIGHIYSTVVTDVITRFHRLIGEKTRFLTAPTSTARTSRRPRRRRASTPIALADRVVERYRELYRTFEIAQRRLHPHDRGAPPARGRGPDRADRRGGRLLHGEARGLVLLELRGLLHREGARRREATVRSTARPTRLGVRGERLLPPLEVRRRRCSRTTRSIPSSCGPRAASPRSSPS